MPEFDALLHHPARLKLAMLLAATTSASFNELAREAKLTPGNLQAHLKQLEAAGYVEAWRGIIELKPRMRYRLSARGAAALRAYCAMLAETVRGIEGLVGSRSELGGGVPPDPRPHPRTDEPKDQ